MVCLHTKRRLSLIYTADWRPPASLKRWLIDLLGGNFALSSVRVVYISIKISKTRRPDDVRGELPLCLCVVFYNCLSVSVFASLFFFFFLCIFYYLFFSFCLRCCVGDRVYLRVVAYLCIRSTHSKVVWRTRPESLFAATGMSRISSKSSLHVPAGSSPSAFPTRRRRLPGQYLHYLLYINLGIIIKYETPARGTHDPKRKHKQISYVWLLLLLSPVCEQKKHTFGERGRYKTNTKPWRINYFSGADTSRRRTSTRITCCDRTGPPNPSDGDLDWRWRRWFRVGPSSNKKKHLKNRGLFSHSSVSLMSLSAQFTAVTGDLTHTHTCNIYIHIR